MTRRSVRNRLLRTTRIPFACLVASLSLYAASPFVTLWSVASALQNHDVTTVQGALDWRTVRSGLKSDLGPGATVSLASSTHVAAAQDELPDFGTSFATTIVSHVVDDVITPEHLVAMLVHAGPADRAAHATGSGALSMLGRVDHVRFIGPSQFEASVRLDDDPKSVPVTVSMRIEKWQWKITRIQMPDQFLSQHVGART
ncbi:DUF2939 domain-containing protein [Lichenicola cladoniae]|uniref:DUF2939 domain-containing protein n=1 Tax=Lichenicola cladoniae TaxID=1484109 RepID=A0A6M8GZ84_9PROT|nr:DUF2939 domain-containing protein [Lichenicola cladoniae]NPD68529.1 DUF2939 domain-containing protein [Acetobacteraceae bacterium]QKE88984.1 DUF2939 domain-containing protein [Lichenicola cladoniae]